jgi:hypothetical protein
MIWGYTFFTQNGDMISGIVIHAIIGVQTQ